MISVQHDPAAHRFTAAVDDEHARLDYTLDAAAMTITHTIVPPAIGGRGVAGELMRAALAHARREGWRVIPVCSYAASYLAKHPDEAPPENRRHESDLRDEALDESFPASDPPATGGIT